MSILRKCREWGCGHFALVYIHVCVNLLCGTPVYAYESCYTAGVLVYNAPISTLQTTVFHFSCIYMYIHVHVHVQCKLMCIAFMWGQLLCRYTVIRVKLRLRATCRCLCKCDFIFRSVAYIPENMAQYILPFSTRTLYMKIHVHVYSTLAYNKN